MIFRFFFTREVRKYPFFFLLLMVTLFLGTFGLLGISLVAQQVQLKLQENANQLLTSDIAVSARRELFPTEQKELSQIFSKFSHKHYEVIDLYSMTSHLKSGESRLVEIRATQGGFPFYGELQVKDGKFDTEKLFISKDLADLWTVEVGDEMLIGEVKLPVAGIVTEDSSLGMRGFSLAPRIYFPLEKLEKSGLIKPGATGSFAHHYKLNEMTPELQENLKKEVFQKISDPAVKVTLPEDSSEQTGRIIRTITNFMSLAALIGLVLSLVGVFYLYQSHLMARLKDLCLLNLYGLTKGKIILGIIAQFSIIFFVVVGIELMIVMPLYRHLAPLLSQNLGFELSLDINLLSIIKELPYLYGLTLFILVPLLMGLMRTSMGLQLKSARIAMGRFRVFDFAPFVVVLWLFSSYLGKSFKTGSLFFGSLCIVFILSTIVVRTSQWLIGRLVKGKGLLLPNVPTGVALRNISRSGYKLTMSFLSLAIGATLISFILQLDRMILKEFAVDGKKPSLFIFDIQEEQMEELTELAKKNETPLGYLTPMIRARLEKVNDKKFMRQKKAYDFRGKPEDEDERARSNTINLTYRDYLTDAEKIIEGGPFPAGGAPDDRLPFVSLEKRWSERMGIEIGDKLTFDVQGVEFEALVHNIREVKWTTFYPNFFVTVEPGLIDAAPKTYLAILPAGPKEKKLSLQRLSVEKFPNISFIDVEELVGKIAGLFIKSRQAIEVISWLSLMVGIVILYGLSHDQVYRRYYDLALMKTLGFSAKDLLLNLFMEFGGLFFSALTLGLGLGWLMAQIIGKEVFKLGLSVDWGRMLYPAAFLTVLCLVTILLSSWRAVRAKPRELLSDA